VIRSAGSGSAPACVPAEAWAGRELRSGSCPADWSRHWPRARFRAVDLAGRRCILFEHGQFGELLGGGLDPARRVRHGPGQFGDGERLPGISSLLADAG
jgi:hypothetical protein